MHGYDNFIFKILFLFECAITYSLDTISPTLAPSATDKQIEQPLGVFLFFHVDATAITDYY